MGNHLVSCCGCNAGDPDLAVGPAPTKPTEADEEDNIQLSSTGVVREPLQLGPLEDRADRADRVRAQGSNDTPSPTAFGNQQREKFGSRVVSSVSLQGMDVDEAPDTRQRLSLKAGTTSSLNSRASKRSKKSMASRISGFFHKGGKKSAVPDFNGQWICVSTWGLDEFLKEMGISYVKRLAASKAPWPSWEFQQEEDKFYFCNHTVMGDIKEEFVANGAPYNTVDGHKQTLECMAFWEKNVLVIERCGPQGRFREERSIDDQGLLVFKLTGLEEGQNTSWGRTFKRKTP